jgi:transposase
MPLLYCVTRKFTKPDRQAQKEDVESSWVRRMGNSERRIKRIIDLLKGYFGITLIKRILCIVMLAFEVDAQEICKKIGLTYKSVKKYERILDGEEYMQLLEMGKHEKRSDLEHHKELIFKELDSGAYRTLREIAMMIKEKTGLERSRNRIQQFLRRNGYKPLRVGFFPSESGWGKAKSVLQ